ncbi:calcium-binding protein 8 isoform X1 [Panthera tigris]|uniref:calcium-binding protein 8 isoform X1 n=1 Tax=Panthera tigris TaxID=9694 RepID=UPI001C6F63B3|nr:calcium-binding protein 8 isoform X1 [Panthera tigris]
MAMRSLGYMPSEVELAIIMQRLDMDGDGQVDFDEFMTILGPKLVSSEGRDGFLGNTIDSIFWQLCSLGTATDVQSPCPWRHRIRNKPTVQKKLTLQKALDIYLPKGKKLNRRILQGHASAQNLSETPRLPEDRVRIPKCCTICPLHFSPVLSPAVRSQACPWSPENYLWS